MDEAKQHVHDFWNAASCGEAQYLVGEDAAAYEAESKLRYALESYIEQFADFASTRGKDVLEIGVGLGADHARFASAGARLHGVDLTPRAIEHTSRRFATLGLQSKLETADAEHLPFPAESFDVVYSWGVLHHSPNTPAAIAEVHRVLRPGGIAKIMIYSKHSLIGYMLWVRYALLRFRPWLSLKHVYANYLESPGTKAYTRTETAGLFSMFGSVAIRTVLTHGDLLSSGAGQRHEGAVLKVARAIWPRRLIKSLLPGLGLFMLIEAKK